MTARLVGGADAGSKRRYFLPRDKIYFRPGRTESATGFAQVETALLPATDPAPRLPSSP